MLKHLPNALTLLRLILAPIVAWAVWQAYADASDALPWTVLAAAFFIVAALTDMFDGMAARAFNAESRFGRIIDPIADKMLVGLPLIALSIAALQQNKAFSIIVALASAVIILRDLLITWIRFTAKDGEGARVSQLAKWKTAVELIAVGAPIVLAAFGALIPPVWLGCLALLTLAATLSAITGLQYLTAKPKARQN
jgi:cardiolipin synthase (CMP-forming)